MTWIVGGKSDMSIGGVEEYFIQEGMEVLRSLDC